MNKLHAFITEGKPYFIAEMSANHANDLNIALATVEAAARAGADCVKVQTYTADTLTLDCDSPLFRIEDGLWAGSTLHELYSQGSLPWEWHAPIKARCEDLGLEFMSTPFDVSAVDFLLELGCDTLKIASFELVDMPLIEYAAEKGKTIILSTGMASLEEIEEAVNAIRAAGNNNVILLRCCSEYPADTADMNLASIPDMAKRFECPVGFSDHSQGYLADVVAATLGAQVIEKHFCLSKDIESPDASFSMLPEEYAEMVHAVKEAVAAVGIPCYEASSAEASNKIFRRSIFACADIPAGTLFTSDNIRVVRPGYGAKPKYYRELIGQRANRTYRFGDPIAYKDETSAQ